MKPFAYATLSKNQSAPQLDGQARFYKDPQKGIWVEVEVRGLPAPSSSDASQFYGLHLHEVGDCTPPFDKTGEHYNPTKQPHPQHAGDFPPLLGNDGYAYSYFYTSRLEPKDIFGKALIIHSNADDFTTQPSGNAGEKIACGIVTRM